jgi:FkbM family methyltransferase
MFYTVFSTNLSEYMQWQSDLLEHSWQKVGQEGSLIRLVATDDPSKLPRQKYAECVATRLWDTHLETGDAYPIYNKPASLLEWLFRDRPEGTVLLLDPDCVFLRPVTRHVAPGFPAAQKWVNLTLHKPGARHPFGLPPGFSFLKDHCARVNLATTPVMIPTLIHTSDLRRVCARWLEVCGIIRQHYRNAQGLPIWEADMYAYLAACAEYRLDHEPISLGICTNWRPADAPEAPIIHYCQAILDRDGNEIFFKYRYRPWSRIDTTRKPSQPYGNDLIAIINDYVEQRNESSEIGCMRVNFGAGKMRPVYFRPRSSDESIIEFIMRHQFDFDRLRRWNELQAFLRQRSMRGERPLIVDAGANIGTSSIWFSFNIEDSHVVAIEPDAGNFALLERNTKGLSVTAVNAAISSTRGFAEVSDPGEGYVGYRTQPSSTGNPGAVPRITIDDLYRQYADPHFPFIVKVDIEGGEADLFACNTEWVKQTPLLIIELHDWLLLRSANSNSFLRCIAALDRDFVYYGEHVYSIANDLHQ